MSRGAILPLSTSLRIYLCLQKTWHFHNVYYPSPRERVDLLADEKVRSLLGQNDEHQRGPWPCVGTGSEAGNESARQFGVDVANAGWWTTSQRLKPKPCESTTSPPNTFPCKQFPETFSYATPIPCTPHLEFQLTLPLNLAHPLVSGLCLLQYIPHTANKLPFHKTQG